MKILIIEDNKEISKNMADFFELSGEKVICKYDGESGLEEALNGNFDIILLDIMIPKIDGIIISEKLGKKIQTPIIMITAKEDLETKLKTFGNGVSDYIVKPFDLRELEARIKAVLQKNQTIFTDENISLDFEKRIFTKENKEIKLSKTEIHILNTLFSEKNKSLSRTYIIETIWGEDAIFASDGKLDVYISNIRKKLGKNIIETQKGFGYRFGKS